MPSSKKRADLPDELLECIVHGHPRTLKTAFDLAGVRLQPSTVAQLARDERIEIYLSGSKREEEVQLSARARHCFVSRHGFRSPIS